MGRPKANESAALERAALIPTEEIAITSHILMDSAQEATLRNIEKRIASASFLEAQLAKEIKKTKARLDESEDARNLKQLKLKIKQAKLIAREAQIAYHGAIELSLAHVEGDSVQEKLRNLKNGTNQRQQDERALPSSL